MARQDHSQQDLRVDHNKTNIETSVNITPDISLAKKGDTQTKSEIENKTDFRIHNNSQTLFFVGDNVKIGTIEQPQPSGCCIVL